MSDKEKGKVLDIMASFRRATNAPTTQQHGIRPPQLGMSRKTAPRYTDLRGSLISSSPSDSNGGGKRSFKEKKVRKFHVALPKNVLTYTILVFVGIPILLFVFVFQNRVLKDEYIVDKHHGHGSSRIKMVSETNADASFNLHNSTTQKFSSESISSGKHSVLELEKEKDLGTVPSHQNNEERRDHDTKSSSDSVGVDSQNDIETVKSHNDNDPAELPQQNIESSSAIAVENPGTDTGSVGQTATMTPPETSSQPQIASETHPVEHPVVQVAQEEPVIPPPSTIDEELPTAGRIEDAKPLPAPEAKAVSAGTAEASETNLVPAQPEPPEQPVLNNINVVEANQTLATSEAEQPYQSTEEIKLEEGERTEAVATQEGQGAEIEDSSSTPEDNVQSTTLEHEEGRADPPSQSQINAQDQIRYLRRRRKHVR